MWLQLGRTARVATAVFGVPLGGVSALLGSHRAAADSTVVLLTLILALTAAVLSLFRASRARAKAVLATAGMVWVGFLGVALVMRMASDWL
jgi:hypothetical protein